MDQASRVQTERGRAWVSAKSPEQSISFPAIVVVDRSEPSHPKLRIEAMDPLGATHALLLLDDTSKLTWIDFDERRVFQMTDTWHGLPLKKLPDLVLGLASIPSDGVVSSSDADGFVVRSGQNTFRYLMDWIDPGPRLALKGIDGNIRHRGHTEKYVVEYSHFMEQEDFYLPLKAVLKGYSGSSPASPDHPDVDVTIDWRERKWNEPVAPQTFNLPPAARNFSRQ